MAEGFVQMLPALIGAGTQLATTLINHGRGGAAPSFQMPGLKLPGQTSPFGGMNPDLIKQIIAQNNNNEGLASLGGFTGDGAGIPMSDAEQQIPQ